MRFSICQETAIGARRANQDRMGYCYTRDALLMLLADGMGGHIQGEVAATIALQTVSALFQEVAVPHVKKPEGFLEDALYAAHREIHRYRALHALPETPRTTIVACLVQHGVAQWAHCGDSRLYWMRGGRVQGRTRDHTRVESLIAQGLLDASAARTHPDRNKLFNCLGAPGVPSIEMSEPTRLEAGDVILLCSDGLWNALPDEAMALHLAAEGVVRAVPKLVQQAEAVAGASSDNVTALAMMWDDAGPAHGEAGVITTALVPLGAVTTTIHAPRQGEPDAAESMDSFNDGDIEQAIAEIRDAIERTSRLTSKP
ncbi:PP2C family protein-serine/threonine phosphatase [Noviherbaspirillum pedocola]|uniref:Serine/threonine-protein phosphatase n=1 Tax=Noviherbaspirillum pedocola TaxID=2801341 RepID=A0A934W6I0_9BURK|nr:PP2C family serine/threonine-protein phosphatase [Noviherbaspirillum pedocola]MBK4736257.1 serine/threonine-protein phosphatase [Noviherbaspirillum pedocola]